MDKNFLLFLEKKRKYFHRLINKEISSFWEQAALQDLTSLPEIKKVAKYTRDAFASPCRYFLGTKGKMLRPILGHLAIEAFGSSPRKFEELLILPQLLHDASLVIDDIEDNATLRRGKPALHLKYGIDTSVNTANAVYFFPFQILKKSKIPKAQKEKVSEILIEAMNRMHIGQGLDVFWHRNTGLIITPEQYMQMVKLKTATFFRTEIQLAALFSRVRKRVEKEAVIFAENLGIAFQIMDDILDITLKKKESRKFGKTFAKYITDGKKTLMVAHVFKKAAAHDKKRLIKILGLRTSKREALEEAISIFKKYNAIQEARSLAEELFTLFTSLYKFIRARRLK